MCAVRLFVLIALAAALVGCSNVARQQARNFQCPGGTVIDVRVMATPIRSCWYRGPASPSPAPAQ